MKALTALKALKALRALRALGQTREALAHSTRPASPRPAVGAEGSTAARERARHPARSARTVGAAAVVSPALTAAALLASELAVLPAASR